MTMSLYELTEPATSLTVSTRLIVGAVRIATPDETIVLAEDALWPARRAASCLLQPEAGDAVLLLAAPERGLTILSVLERASRSPILLTHEDGIVLRAPTLALIADDALRVAAPKAAMDIAEWTMRSAAATLVAKTGSVVADTLRTIAGKIEQTADSLLTQATHRTTIVSSVDTFDAHAANSKVATTLVVQTGSTVLTAEQDIRMDAERIAMG
jgi:hypothetical protein